MTALMDKYFLLNTATARQLYKDYAAELPIIDYHSHLQQGEILDRKKFRNMTELWLGGDHYKWRLMRAAGVPEELVTGHAPDREKFDAFCRILPLAAGNAVHHFSHLELRRIFGMDVVINEKNANRIWEEGNAKLAELDTWTLLDQAKVEVACTTDDPADDFEQHAAIAKSALKTKVFPAYRPDKAMRINQDGFIEYLQKLGKVADVDIGSFADMARARVKRVAFFHSRGARVSDHAIDIVLPAAAAASADIETIFKKCLAGGLLSDAEQGIYIKAMLTELGRAYAEHGWVMCFHIGALRSSNSRMLATLGPDTGYDSVSDMSCVAGLASLLDGLDRDEKLPKTMLFCLDDNMNTTLTTLAACFQDGKTFGKVQFGPAWWFNDHKSGNLQQLVDFANNGLLGTFVGMLTDSRSFASYPRHDYFRRLLCRLLGEWVESGEYPADQDALATLVEGICYKNAKQYFGM